MNLIELPQVENEKLFQAIDQSYEGFLLSDLDGRVFYANKAVEEISGVKIEGIVGKTTKEMEQKGIIISQSMKVLTKDPLTISQTLSNGREVFITSKPIYDEAGKVICYAANYRNLQMLNDLHKAHHEQVDINYTELQQLRSQLLKTDEWISSS